MLLLYRIKFRRPELPKGELLEVPLFKALISNGTDYLTTLEDETAEQLSRAYGFELTAVIHKEQIEDRNWIRLERG